MGLVCFRSHEEGNVAGVERARDRAVGNEVRQVRTRDRLWGLGSHCKDGGTPSE